MKTIDIEDIQFTSSVFPTAEDVALGESLDDDERKAVIERDLKEAKASGIAPRQTMAEIIAEMRAKTSCEL